MYTNEVYPPEENDEKENRWIEISVVVFFLILFVLFFCGQISAVDISACGVLTGPSGTTHSMVDDIYSSAGGNCISFGNDSQTLDCDWHTIYFRQTPANLDNAILVQDFNNITVQNCNLSQNSSASGTNANGTFIKNSNYSTFKNMKITTKAQSDYNLIIDSVNFINMDNITLFFNNATAGIRIFYASGYIYNSNFTNFVINTTSTSTATTPMYLNYLQRGNIYSNFYIEARATFEALTIGMIYFAPTNFVNITFNNFTLYDPSITRAYIKINPQNLQAVSNINFTNFIILGNPLTGVALYNNSGTTANRNIRNVTFFNISGLDHVLFFGFGNSSAIENYYLINAPLRNLSAIACSSPFNVKNVTWQWQVKANVTDHTGNAITGATCNSTNERGVFQNFGATGADGLTDGIIMNDTLFTCEPSYTSYNITNITCNYSTTENSTNFTIISNDSVNIRLGIGGADITAPREFLDAPINGTVTNIPTVTFNCSATDGTQLANLTIYIWNITSLVYNNTQGIINLANRSNWTINLMNGSYWWTCNATDNSSNVDSNETVWNVTISNYTPVTNPDLNCTLIFGITNIRFNPQFAEAATWANNTFPINQSATFGTINCTNNGTASGSLYIKLNDSWSGVDSWASQDGWITNVSFTHIKAQINASVGVGERVYIFLARNYSLTFTRKSMAINVTIEP